MLIVLYVVTGCCTFVWPCRTELPPRSAVFFSAAWPIMWSAVALHLLNRWTEQAFSWAVERLD